MGPSSLECTPVAEAGLLLCSGVLYGPWALGQGMLLRP